MHYFITGRLPLNLLSASVAKDQHFRPCRKKYALDRKMIPTFYNCQDVLYQHAKFGGDRATHAGFRRENWCFLYVTLARGGHSSNKYCATVYGSILMRFSALFQNGLFFQMHYIVLIFIASWRHNFREIAFENLKSSKISRKVCAHHFI